MRKYMIQYGKIFFILLFVLTSVIPLFSQDTDPEKTSRMGIEYGKQKQYNDAIEQFDKSIDVYNAKSAKTYHNKGWALELKDDITGAIAAYEEAVKRNPNQVHTLERLGFLYFKTGKYTEAVLTGEKVISIDPENQEVIKWLPEAYAMKLKKFQEELAAKKNEEKSITENVGEAKQEEEKEKDKEKPVKYVRGTLEFMIRNAYYTMDSEEDKGYAYKSTPGLLFDIPYMLNVKYTPVKLVEISLETGNPFFGALMPNLIYYTEKIEGTARLGKYALGLGILGNHYNDVFAFGDWKPHTEHDYKFGLVFGYGKDNAELLFSIYPRMLIKDDESSTGKTLDTDLFIFDYKFKIDDMMSFYSWTSAKDFYYFDHDIDISNYWGVYEFGFGIQLGKYREVIKYIKYFSVSADYTARFYLLDLFNEDPYGFANGQGLFGANSSKWFRGDPFSGYRSMSNVLSVKAEQGILDYLFVYQKIIVEITDKDEDHNEFNFVIGVGGSY